MATTSVPPSITPIPSHLNNQQTHLYYLRACLSLSQQSPPKPTNFRVGAILLSRMPTTIPTNPPNQLQSHTPPTTYTDTILSTGYTLELSGNTHAEQCALAKYAARHGVSEEHVGDVLPPPPTSASSQFQTTDPPRPQSIILYVTMEPCGKRLSGNNPCAARIIQTRTPSRQNTGPSAGGTRRGIDKVYFGVKEPGTFVGGSVGCRMLTEAGVEWEVVGGLEKEILKVAMEGHEERKGKGGGDEVRGTNIDDISEEERRRQDAMPRNPLKRMMEADI
ncbi:cytidine and deoxycytidylate deaminase zinc-binding domain-containing protein [Paracoccidioides lutzii Pb01]|uniref:Cytidine and deoxycytidylate deaminase zinc-binding domain-containing protein n=1 Tax=Paracoccidioides lutzii (strain ATCC MYA-826 / Pb01) TaxID=502779 RepID=C1H5T6_PARBA|nr:cytidine and deoxycytidylate deaminase zinc-binding domain-containing protein [Paracoccidioides lutzii Pb01]EEH35234.1 cytidine and deoxycytidylate deaminase zinc-binding domain-containing protein [Paracoccidioides lutzii Pb01]